MGLFDRFRPKQAFDQTSAMAAAAVLSEAILRASLRAAREIDQMEEQHSPVGSGKSGGWGVAFEFMHFFLHIADRLAFGILGPDNRSFFMDTLASMTFDATVEVMLQPGDVTEQGELKQALLSDSTHRNVSYGACKKLFPEEGALAKDTVFWEFGKKLAESVGQPEDIRWIMGAIMVAMAALKVLDINAAIRSI
jgi:hypothetical protein